jgi:hypothetical protein
LKAVTVACHICWCKYAGTEQHKSTLAYSRARCFSVWKKTDIQSPLDVLRGTVHLLPRTLLADDKDTFCGLRNPIALEPVSKLVQAPWRLRMFDWLKSWALMATDWPKSWAPMVIDCWTKSWTLRRSRWIPCHLLPPPPPGRRCWHSNCCPCPHCLVGSRS